MSIPSQANSQNPLRWAARVLEAAEASPPLVQADASGYREHFLIPEAADGEPAAYLVGHSLGVMPKRTAHNVLEFLQDWADRGVRGHFEGEKPWLPYHERVAEPLARVLGAKPSEVVAMGSLTNNLHLLFTSFYRPNEERFHTITEGNTFPSDKYALDSQAKLHSMGSILEFPQRPGEYTHHLEDILDFIDSYGERTSVVWLGAVNYLTGQLFDCHEITKKAHQKGCKIGLDLAHAAGNVPLQLHEWGVDFAAGCSYKYLNGGSGGIGFIYVNEQYHNDKTLPRLEGWWGHNKKTRFDMPDAFDPIPTAEAWQLSNPSIMPLAALSASLDLFDAAGMDVLRQRSINLTNYLVASLDPLGVEMLTPTNVDERGAQISFLLPDGVKNIEEKLFSQGVYCDFRQLDARAESGPNVVRVAPSPLYNNRTDITRFVTALKKEI